MAIVDDLASAEPSAHAHARAELKKWGLDASRVVSVYPDSVLFIDDTGRAMTAWARRKKNGTLVYVGELGFKSEPSPYIDEVLDD